VRRSKPDRSGAERSGSPDPSAPNSVAEQAQQRWELAVGERSLKAGRPSSRSTLADKIKVWSTDAGRIYAQGAVAQWDPATAIPWNTNFELPPEVEDVVVQSMT